MSPAARPVDRLRVHRLLSEELSPALVAALRALLDSAFGDDPDERFAEDDWDHAVGGLHLVAELDGDVVGHAAVVPRTLHVAGLPIRAGYVEAVATAASHRRLGVGTRLMREVADHVRERYELGALGTGAHRFYERLGWRTWRGPSSVRTPEGERRTPDDDGFILVLETPSTPTWLDLDAPIASEWRPGDVW